MIPVVLGFLAQQRRVGTRLGNGVLILLGDCVIVVMQLRHDVSVVALLQEHLLSFLSFSRVKSVKYNYI